MAFLRRLSAITRVHLYVRLHGKHEGNIHSHFLLGVSLDEHHTFMDRLSAFTPWKSWRHKTMEFTPFCPVAGGGWDGKKTIMYMNQDKHSYHRKGWVCPNRDKACRKGECIHVDKYLSLTAHGVLSR